MKRETISQALDLLEERHVSATASFDPGAIQEPPERITAMKKKRIISLALAAALILTLSVAAYAAWSVHAAKQQELKEDFRIAENNVESYVEYTVPDEGEGLVLLSAVNDGQEQRVYVNISPVTEVEAAAFPENAGFGWRIEGTDCGGYAAPHLPVNQSVSGTERIRAAVLAHAYDRDTQTLTLQCFIDVQLFRKAAAELGTESVPLTVQMSVDGDSRSFGPVSLSLTAEQRRYFDFGHALYHDEETDREIELVGLELTPFSAVWKMHYEGDEALHRPDADWETYGPWIQLEDKICIQARLIFSDGSEFSTGGALTCPYENGTVNPFCGWGGAIDIGDVQRIVLGDLVLWDENS